MRERVTMVRAKILLSLVTTVLLTSRPSMGMRLEPGGEYTGVTLVISDDVPDHDCEEMLAKIKVRLSQNGKKYKFASIGISNFMKNMDNMQSLCV